MVLGQMSVMPLPFDPPLIDGLNGAALHVVLTGTSAAFTRGIHRHPHGELFLLRSGYLKSHSTTGRWLIPAGHLCWVPPFAEHGADAGYTQGVRLYLASEFCTGLPDDPCLMRSTPLILAVIDRLLASTTPSKTLSEQESRLLAVLWDEIEQARSTPIALKQDGTRDPESFDIASV